MEFLESIRPELLIVALGLYFVGFGLKKIKRLKDNFIPLILGALGIVACSVYIGILDGFGWQAIASGAVQGVFCAAASTYVNQVIKQMQKLGYEETVTEIAETLVEKTKGEK